MMVNDTTLKELAALKILIILRNPLMLTSIPDREDIIKLATDYSITALDLIKCAHINAKNK